MSGSAISQLLEPVRALFENRITRHFFTGGSSPVATRQIRDASIRAAIVAPAAIPA
jgi:hypothetical protein